MKSHSSYSRSDLASRWLVLLLIPMLFAYPVLAKEPLDGGASKISVVDIRRAVLQTEKAQARLEELKNQADFKANIESIEGLEKEYKALLEAYKKDRAVMSAEKKLEEEKLIIDKRKDLEYINTKLQQAQKEWAAEVMENLGQSLSTVLENLVKEQNIGLLLRMDSGAVMVADDSYDISAQVTERLNQIR